MKRNFYFLIIIMITFKMVGQYDINHVVISNYTKSLTTDQVHKVLSYDLNNDGKKDIIIDGGMTLNQSGFVQETNKAIILLGNGDGSFGNQTYFQKPDTMHSISDFGDYNNDGKPDMLVYGLWQNGFSLYTGGNGVMNFSSIQNFTAGTHGYEAKFKDYDNDGDLDILTITSGSANTVYFHTYTNTNGSFVHASYSLNDDKFYPNYEYVDINNDGLMDVMANSDSNLVMLFQNPNHTFTATSQNISNTTMYGPDEYYFSYKDYNNDGKVDIVSERGYELKLVKGNSASPNINIANVNNTVNPFDLKLFSENQFYSDDIDNDGFMDIISYSGSYSGVADDELIIYFDPFNFNNHKNQLTIPLNVECISLSLKALLVEDFNQDNKKDILALGMDNKVRVFLNQSVLSVNENNLEHKNLKVYPTPSKDLISIDYSNHEDVFMIFDCLGREIKSIRNESNNNSITVDIQSLQDGMYSVVGYCEGRKVSSQKIIKN